MAVKKPKRHQFKYIAKGDTQQDFVVLVPQFLEAIEVGWLDGFLRQFAEAAHNRFYAMKQEEDANGSPDGAPTLDDGIYYLPEEGAYYRVRPNANGTKRYAQMIVYREDDGSGKPNIDYEYARGKIYMLSRRKDAMVGIVGAVKFLQETGLCLRCGEPATVTSFNKNDLAHGACVRSFEAITWETAEEDEEDF